MPRRALTIMQDVGVVQGLGARQFCAVGGGGGVGVEIVTPPEPAEAAASSLDGRGGGVGGIG